MRKEELKTELRKIMTLDTVFVCIGTMNSIIDSLGPLIGKKLEDAGLKVCGTLLSPYHALTYEIKNKILNEKYKDNNKIAIDACVCGEEFKLYKVGISSGPISPGAGCNKRIPAIGDYSLRGFLLYKTERNLVYNHDLIRSCKYDEKVRELKNMVDLISQAIIEVHFELILNQDIVTDALVSKYI